MRNLVYALLAGVLFILGGCSDSPTLHDSAGAPARAMLNQQGQGCVTDGLCILPPLIVDPGECDPWMSLDWCGGDCMTSDHGMLGCPPGGGGGDPGDGGAPPSPPPTDPGAICPTADDGSCIPPDEESIICPYPWLGRTQPTLITVAGRNHEFQFSSTATYPMRLKSAARSPAIYEIGFPTTSTDAWWIAEAGTVTVYCRGVYVSRSRTWVGTVTVLDSDLHMVMGLGHPDF